MRSRVPPDAALASRPPPRPTRPLTLAAPAAHPRSPRRGLTLGAALFAGSRGAAPSRPAAGRRRRRTDPRRLQASPRCARASARDRPGAAHRARRRLPAAGARDRRPELLRARPTRCCARRSGARPARRRRAHRAGHARALAPRLPRRPALADGRAPARSRARSPPTRCSSTRRSSSVATAPPSARCSAWSTCKPDLPAYARVSYLRELHGDLAGRARGDGARRGRRRGAAPENVAVRAGAARRPRACPRPHGAGGAPAYATALARGAGLRARARPGARRLAAARGRLGRAIATPAPRRRRGCRCPST